MIDLYSNEIIGILANGLSTDQLCSYLGLCPKVIFNFIKSCLKPTKLLSFIKKYFKIDWQFAKIVLYVRNLWICDRKTWKIDLQQKNSG